MSLLWMTEDELNSDGGRLDFENGERVRLLITKIVEDSTYGKLTVHARVMSDNHKGKLHVEGIFRSTKDGKINPGYRAFVKTFFSDEEIKEKKAVVGKLIDRIFSATVKRSPSKDGAKMYQNLGNFKDEGMSPSAAGTDIPF